MSSQGTCCPWLPDQCRNRPVFGRTELPGLSLPNNSAELLTKSVLCIVGQNDPKIVRESHVKIQFCVLKVIKWLPGTSGHNALSFYEALALLGLHTALIKVEPLVKCLKMLSHITTRKTGHKVFWKSLFVFGALWGTLWDSGALWDPGALWVLELSRELWDTLELRTSLNLSRAI